MERDAKAGCGSLSHSTLCQPLGLRRVTEAVETCDGPAYVMCHLRGRKIHLMEKAHLASHAEVERVLRHAGIPAQQIEDALRRLPDPLDERDCEALERQFGISREMLMDRRGGSP